MGTMTALPIETLEAHHRLLLSPSNLFLVPLAWAGLAELPEVTAAIRRVTLGMAL